MGYMNCINWKEAVEVLHGVNTGSDYHWLTSGLSALYKFNVTIPRCSALSIKKQPDTVQSCLPAALLSSSSINHIAGVILPDRARRRIRKDFLEPPNPWTPGWRVGPENFALRVRLRNHNP